MCTRMIPLLARLITVDHLPPATCVSELPIPLFTQINVKTPSFPGIYCFSRKISAFSLFFIRIGYIRARVVLAACAVAQPCAISFSYRRESPTSLACCFVFKYKTGPTAKESDITATSYNGFISFQSHARRSNQVSLCVASGRKNAT